MYMHVHKSRDIQIRVDERSGNNEYYIPTSASMRGVQKHAMYAAVASLPSDAVRLAVAHGPVPFSDVANSQQYDKVGGEVSTPLPLLITRLQALDQHEHEVSRVVFSIPRFANTRLRVKMRQIAQDY